MVSKNRLSLAKTGYLALLGCLIGGFSIPLTWFTRGLVPWAHREDASDSDVDASTAARMNRLPGDSMPIQIIDVIFEVSRIELPLTTVQHSRKVWNHVDELRIDPELLARLVRNGLRIGAVSKDAWPAIQTILDACDATVQTEQVVGHSGLPVTLQVGTIGESESVFSYGPNNDLVGKTFNAGDKLVHILYAVYPEMGGRIDLQIGLEVFHDRGVMTWEKTGGVIRQVPNIDRNSFLDLRPVVSLNPGEILVIGPSEEAENIYLVGSRFFTGTREGKRYETLYCIAPRPFERRGAFRQAG